MNIRAKTILTAVVLAASASALSSQAADQSAYFEQEGQVTAGFYPQSTVQPTPLRTKPETAHQAAENAWLAAERNYGSVAAIPFPVPNVAPRAAVSPETPHQAAEDAWLTAERNSGSVVAIPFPVPNVAPAAAVSPETPHQVAENAWLTQQRNLTNGSYALVPFAAMEAATIVAARR